MNDEDSTKIMNYHEDVVLIQISFSLDSRLRMEITRGWLTQA